MPDGQGYVLFDKTFCLVRQEVPEQGEGCSILAQGFLLQQLSGVKNLFVPSCFTASEIPEPSPLNSVRKSGEDSSRGNLTKHT